MAACNHDNGSGDALDKDETKIFENPNPHKLKLRESNTCAYDLNGSNLDLSGNRVEGPVEDQTAEGIGYIDQNHQGGGLTEEYEAEGRREGPNRTTMQTCFQQSNSNHGNVSGGALDNDETENLQIPNPHRPKLRESNTYTLGSDPDLESGNSVAGAVEDHTAEGIVNIYQNGNHQGRRRAVENELVGSREGPNMTTMQTCYQQSTRNQHTHLAGARTNVKGDGNITIPNATTVIVNQGNIKEDDTENTKRCENDTKFTDYGRGLPYLTFNELCLKVTKYINNPNNDVLDTLRCLCMVNSDDPHSYGIPIEQIENVRDGFDFIICLQRCKLLSPKNIFFLQYLLHKIDADSDLQKDVLAFAEEQKNNPVRMIVERKSAVQGAVSVTFHIKGNFSEFTQMNANEFCDVLEERLGIPRHLITIVGLQQGSIIITLQMPRYWKKTDLADCLLRQFRVPEKWIISCKIFAIEIFGKIYELSEMIVSSHNKDDICGKDIFNIHIKEKVKEKEKDTVQIDSGFGSFERPKANVQKSLIIKEQSCANENRTVKQNDNTKTNPKITNQSNTKHKALTRLHYAAIHGNDKVCTSLLEAGADLNARDACDCTPLHCAVIHSNETTCLSLLKAGADPNLKDDLKHTPLHYAAKHCDETICATLLKANADPNMTDDLVSCELNIRPYTTTRRCKTAKRCNTNVCVALLEAGADPNIKDRELLGRTPLHYAAIHGDDKMSELLVKAGADLSSKDKCGCTPFDYAAERGLNKLFGLRELPRKAFKDPKVKDIYEKTDRQANIVRSSSSRKGILHPDRSLWLEQEKDLVIIMKKLLEL